MGREVQRAGGALKIIVEPLYPSHYSDKEMK